MIQEKDVAGATALIRKLGMRVDQHTLARCLHDFQYKAIMLLRWFGTAHV